MPRGRLKGSPGGNRTARRYTGGRPALPLDQRRANRRGKLTIEIDPASGALAQRLMLRFPECRTVAALYELAIERLAEAVANIGTN